MVLSKRLNFSATTTVAQIEKFLQANIAHRQGMWYCGTVECDKVLGFLFENEGYTYGAPDNKNFVVFIDDVNATSIDGDGVARCDEVIWVLLNAICV